MVLRPVRLEAGTVREVERGVSRAREWAEFLGEWTFVALAAGLGCALLLGGIVHALAPLETYGRLESVAVVPSPPWVSSLDASGVGKHDRGRAWRPTTAAVARRVSGAAALRMAGRSMPQARPPARVAFEPLPRSRPPVVRSIARSISMPQASVRALGATLVKPVVARFIAAPLLLLPHVHATSRTVVARLMPHASVLSRGARRPVTKFRPRRRRPVRLRAAVVGLLPAVSAPAVATPEALPTMNLPRRRRFPF